MRTKIDVELKELKCYRSNESNDEPYLWIFSVKMDGTTVVWDSTKARFDCSAIKVNSHSGSHGGLGLVSPSPLLKTSFPITIPPEMAIISEILEPIEMPESSNIVQLPGTLFLIVIAMEEDSSSDTTAEEARKSGADFIELQIVDFLEKKELKRDIINRAKDFSSLTTISAANYDAAFVDIQQGLREKLVDMAPYLRPTVGIPDLDPDDCIGAAVMLFDQSTAETKSFEELIDQNGAAPEGRYSILGDITAHLFYPVNFSKRQTLLSSKTVQKDNYALPSDISSLCVTPGQVIHWEKLNSRYEQFFTFQESASPFELRWRIEGQTLNSEKNGTSTIEVQTDCLSERFDASHLKGPVPISLKKTAVVQFEKTNENGFEGIKLSNDPQDGNYWLTVEVFVTIGHKDRLLIRDYCYFKGQSVISDFYTVYKKCIEKYEDVSDNYARSRHFSRKDLKNPFTSDPLRWYENQIKIAEGFVSNGKLSQIDFENFKERLNKSIASYKMLANKS